MLLELERECLEVYRRKVDLANRSQTQLRQATAECEVELATICSAIGERPMHIRQCDQNSSSLKAELRAIIPELEEMRKRNSEKRNQFVEVLEQIQRIQMEIYTISFKTVLDETELSIRKLEELHVHLQALEKEKDLGYIPSFTNYFKINPKQYFELSIIVMELPFENLLDLVHEPFTHTSTFAKGWSVPRLVKFFTPSSGFEGCCT